MSSRDTGSSVRAVEVGEIIPRISESTSSKHYIGLGAALIGLAGVLALLLGPPAQYLAAVPVLALGGLGVYAHTGDDNLTLPQIPGVALRSFSTVDADCMANHLVGDYSGPTRGLPGGEVVIARVDAESAAPLSRVPAACEERWNSASLQTILIAIPRGPPEAIAEVAEAYDMTLLVEDPADVPALLGYLPDLVTEPEGQSLQGVGSATIRQTPIQDRLPDDPGLREDINKGRGKPLAPLARHLRTDPVGSPAMTMTAAPREYVEPVVNALSPIESDHLTIQHGEPQIDTLRLYLTNVPASEAALGQLRRGSIRSDGAAPPKQKPEPDCQQPSDEAPESDRSLSPSC